MTWTVPQNSKYWGSLFTPGPIRVDGLTISEIRDLINETQAKGYPRHTLRLIAGELDEPLVYPGKLGNVTVHRLNPGDSLFGVPVV